MALSPQTVSIVGGLAEIQHPPKSYSYRTALAGPPVLDLFDVATQSHESLTSFRKVSESSERKFGVTVGLILSFIAIWPVIRHHHPARLWLLAIGAVLVLLGIAMPKALKPLNRLWFKLGLLLARVTNPIVMGLMFFVAVVPFGWFLRLRGHDLLRLKRDAASQSYWIERDPHEQTSLTKQF